MMELPGRVGTIGAGNMAEAILRGLLRAGMGGDQLVASDVDGDRRATLERELGVRTTNSNAELAASVDVAVLAVKPQVAEAATLPLRTPGARPLYVSICAGLTTARLRELLGSDARIVRTMPNTPALIGAGITAMATDSGVSEADLDQTEAVLSAIGEVVRVPESALDAVTGLSGSGPAYAYVFVEALTEGGIQAGLPAEIAHQLATATVLGAARMVHETGEHPARLRERVTSPGGTTVAGLAALEQGGLRATIIDAVAAATRRSRELAEDG